MNGVLAWVKSNVLIVIFAVLIIAMPVGGYFGASVWNKKIKTKAQEELNSKKRLVDGVSRVTYTVPPIAANEQPVSDSRAPNAAVTAFFEAQRAERQEEIEAVVTRAVRFNKTEDRRVLEPGLLPRIGDDREARRRAKDLGERIVGDEDRPSLYEPLFRQIRAGLPAEKADVARRVVDAYQAEVDRAGGDLNGLDEDEQKALTERMKAVRYSAYARRAQELGVYASVDALRDPGTDGVPVIPLEAPSGTPDESELLAWQMDYWLVEDLLRAVDLANRTPDGLPTEIPNSPVKRIVSIDVDDMKIPEKPDENASSSSSSSSGGGGMNDPFGGRGSGLARTPMPMPQMGGGMGMPGKPIVTHTGRKLEDKNGVYLVRHATITVVASSEDLVRVLESFGAANFMTVTDVDLSEVDRWADLEQGFYYGPDHVVKAEIQVEAAYLHFWLADVVPAYVATAWGMELPAAPAENAVP